jgi:ribA/ribD-fused uncharacterized protein
MSDKLIDKYTFHVKGFQGKYRFLSNFWPAEIELDGWIYPTVEHAYMASKTFNIDIREKIRSIEKPGDAKKLGRQIELREDWELVKRNIMKDLVRQKFNKEPLRSKLVVELRDAYLEETNTWNDTYWGVCKGIGRNELGKILMEVRAELQLEELNESY